MRHPAKGVGQLSPVLHASPSVADFFREIVDRAADSGGFEASGASRTYVVALLSDYAKPTTATEQLLRQPLTFLLAKAMDAAGPERFERLRLLGDEALYLSGFYSDHLSRRGIQLSFASGVGAVAYDSAAAMLSRVEGAGGPLVFHELADKFDMFVELLNAVADQLAAEAARGEQGLLELYERWLRSGSQVFADTLLDRGVLPVRGDDTIH